jgi:hypothetical protein
MGADPVNNTDPSGGIVAGPFVRMSSWLFVRPLVSTGVSVGNAVGNREVGVVTNGAAVDNISISANPQVANQNKGYIPDLWQPLTKQILKDEINRSWRSSQPPTENDYGSIFEIWFETWVEENGYSTGDANIHRNNHVMKTDLVRNTAPDFLGDEQVYFLTGRTIFGFPKVKKINVESAHAYELKAKGGGLYLSSNQWQMKGHIDNMANDFAPLEMAYSRAPFHPKVTLVTTSDVRYSRGIAKYAASRNVVYEHIVAEYRYNESGNFETRFTKSIGTNYNLALQKFIPF